MKRFVSPNELYLPNSDKYIPDCHKGLKNESCPQWQHLLHSGDWWYPFFGSFQLILNLILLLIFFCILWLIFKVALNVYGHVCMAFFFLVFFPSLYVAMSMAHISISLDFQKSYRIIFLFLL